MQSNRSLKWNAGANFVALGYTTVIGVVVLPLYLQFLGAEAFGLIGFFLMLQAWMQIFDMGMSPLLSRQTARYRGQSRDYLGLRKLLRSLELIILAVAIVVFVGIATSSSWLAENWLNAASISSTVVAKCIVLMGSIVALRFFAALYRSGVQGTEKQVALNVANVVAVSVKFVGAYFLLRFITQDIVEFFIYQLFAGALELVMLATMFYRIIPSKKKAGFVLHWDALKPVIPFASGIAYSATIWVVLTQLDKLVLSNALSLSEYGYFSLVAVLATGISQIGAPVSQAILPRMTFLLSQDKEQEMLLLYRQSTQLMAVIILPLAGIIALYARELLFAWTGDHEAAAWAGPVLFWFALGNGVLAISAFQFYLQFAYGQLKMHVIFNTITAALQIPLIVYAAYEFGVIGVAITWFALRMTSFLIWTPIVHKKFARGMHCSWLVRDIGPSLAVTSVLLWVVTTLQLPIDEMSRAAVFASLFGIGILMLVCNTLVSRAPRNLLLGFIARSVSNAD